MTPNQLMLRGLNCGKRLLLPFAVALLLALAGTATQAAALRCDVFLGYSGLVPDEGWFPITFELQNDGPGFNGLIEISASQIGRGQVRRVRVDLPTGTLKRVVIPIFTAARTWDVRLLDERGKVRYEQTGLPARLTSHELPLVVGLCRTAQGLPTFPELPMAVQFQTSSTYGAARLQADTFPDNPLAMESIDLLYLNSAKALELKEPQAQALRAWLQNGGHLVVGVEQISDITGNPWLRELMPCELADTRLLNDHPRLQQWLRSPWSSTRFQNPAQPYVAMGMRGNPRGNQPPNGAITGSQGGPPAAGFPANVVDDLGFEGAPLPVVSGTLRDGTVLIGDDSAPLAVTAGRGRGRITVLMFSPEREPFVSWQNRGWFWAKLAEVPLARLTSVNNGMNNARLGSDGIFDSMIDSKQVRKLPLPWLLALLVAYLAVIGPLDQYWLKKINRQMLTWVTFPLYVVGFSGLIYLIGYHLRAGELEWNEMNVVDVVPDLQPDAPAAVLRGETYISIYSPVNAHYPMGSVQPFATLRGQYGGNYGNGSESGGASIVQTGNGFDAEAYVPVWTSQRYVSEWMQRAQPAPLTLSVARRGAGWSATLQNNTERNLPDARLVLGQRLYPLGALAPHQGKTFELGGNTGTALSGFVNQYAQPFRMAVSSLTQNFGNNNVAIGNVTEGAMAASFLGEMNTSPGGMQSFEVFRSRDLSRFADADHAILLAWDPGHSPAAPLNHFTAKRTHRDTLFRLVAPVN